MKLILKKGNLGLFFLNILLSVFLITKMERGLSGSTQVGGIWNYIQLFVIVLSFLIGLIHINDIIKQPCCSVMLLYSVVAFLNSFPRISSLSVGSIYSLSMIVYPGFLLCLYYCLCQVSDCRNIRIYILVYYIIAALFFVHQINYYTLGEARAMISNAYYVLSLLPIVMIFLPKWKVVSVITAFLCIVISAKRTGLIAIILCVVGYYFIRALFQGSVVKLLKTICITVVSIIILLYLLRYLDDCFSIGLIDRMLQVFEDGGSGRDVRWLKILDELKKSNILQLLFGHGDGSLSRNIGNAHNDFLQVLYEYGIAAFLFYLLYFIRLIRVLVHMVKCRYRYAPEFFMSIIISMTLALFSFYVIEGTFITCGMICQGYFLADFKKTEQKKRRRNE